LIFLCEWRFVFTLISIFSFFGFIISFFCFSFFVSVNYLFIQLLFAASGLDSLVRRESGPPTFSSRPKLKLLPRTVKDPVNALADTMQKQSIFGGAKPREENVGGPDSRRTSESNPEAANNS
jgi:hypothetical protein